MKEIALIMAVPAFLPGDPESTYDHRSRRLIEDVLGGHQAASVVLEPQRIEDHSWTPEPMFDHPPRTCTLRYVIADAAGSGGAVRFPDLPLSQFPPEGEQKLQLEWVLIKVPEPHDEIPDPGEDDDPYDTLSALEELAAQQLDLLQGTVERARRVIAEHDEVGDDSWGAIEHACTIVQHLLGEAYQIRRESRK